ncbi:MAG: isochorismatase family protein [Pseudobdellovibrionaceae bacterium]
MAHKTSLWDADDCALILIDYQPEMFRKIKSSDPALVELNICALTELAVSFKIPVILSTVGVQMGVNRPTIESLRKEIPNASEIDRSTMNAWEDAAFVKAVKATGKKRLIFCALWTEICLAFPVIDALDDGYQVAIIVDAVGGESKIEHETAILRLIDAGAIPNTTMACMTEWFRDWKSPRAEIAREQIVKYLKDKHQFEEEITGGPKASRSDQDRFHPSH